MRGPNTPPPELLHADWVTDTVIPEIFAQARRKEVGSLEVALFLFGSIAAIIESQGVDMGRIFADLKARSVLTHQPPETRQ